jgi:hypothetical protein
MLGKTKTRTIIIFFTIIFVLIALFFKGNGINTSNNNLMALSTFMFGIFVAFSIASAHDKIRKVNEFTNAEEGNTIFLYKSLSLWGEDIQQKIQQLIDEYLIDQIDYKLQDFRYSSKSFMKLFDFVINIECKNDAQKTIYENIINTLEDSLKNRKQVESLVKERMALVEWVSIIILLLVNISFMFNMNDGSIINIFSTILLSVASITLVLILRSLDSLNWKESTWIWEPLENLFKELDLLPYYADVVKAGRVKLEEGTRIRVAEYPNKYPDMTGKIIKEIEI